MIRPVERHRLNVFRETAINYEIGMEMKYIKVSQMRIQKKDGVRRMRKVNHQVADDITRALEQ